MSRLYVAPDGYDDPTIWLDTGNPERPEPVLSRTDASGEGFDALAELVEMRERVEVLTPDECWVTRSAASISCTAMIGGGPSDGAKWTEDMCCLPCRLRAALDGPTS